MDPKTTSRKQGRTNRGFVMFVYTVSIALIVLVLGLAIDAGVLYLIKGRLQAASDAAALAAARSLNLSADTGSQETDATRAALSFFGANFPNNLWGTSGSGITTAMSYGSGPSANTLNITTTSSTNAPTYFMKWLGYNTVPITVTGTASRRDLNLILVLDQSGSMNTPHNGIPACASMIAAAKAFVGMFSNGRDSLGMLTFNAGAQERYVANLNFKTSSPSIVDAINNISCDGWTGTANALHLAYTRLQTMNQPGKLNAIILFTGGQANTITAELPILSVSGNRWNYNSPPSLASFGPSGCSGAMLPTGTISGDPGGGSTGTYGLFTPTTVTVPEPIIVARGSCAYPGNTARIREDVAYIPDNDKFGNSTRGYRDDWNMARQAVIAGQDTFPSGTYTGKTRPDQSQTVSNAANNATDSQGTAIRADATLHPMILTIGLGGTSGYPPDNQLLMRLANLPNWTDTMVTPAKTLSNPIYDPTKQIGIYVYSPSSSDLLGAFSRVGSFLTELTK